MPAYKIVGKHIFRFATQDIQMGTRSDGSPNMVRQLGPMTRLDVGTVVEDLTPEELAAAPDRFAQVDEAAVTAYKEEPHTAALNTPLRGCHEPVNSIVADIQKPPLTGPEVEGKLAAEAEVAKVMQEQRAQHATMATELTQAQDKAMEEATKIAQQRAQQAAKSGRATPTPGALPVSTSGTPDPASTAPAEAHTPSAGATTESGHSADGPGGRRRP